MQLAPFEHRYASLVLSWATSRAELSDWASLAALPSQEIFVEWLADPDCHAWLLCDREPIAYAELWVSEQESEVEIAHVLVSPARRDQGVGRQLVRLLIEEGQRFSVTTAWVRVAPANMRAARCYQGAGFLRASPEHEAELNVPQPRPYHWFSRPLRPAEGRRD
jgi:ribosomal protein S18 acetylase RimI-like enzyme